MVNRKCNLECTEGNVDDEEEVVEFVGPVKIVLVDQPNRNYRNKVCNAAIVVLAQMAMAIVCLVVIFYSLSYKKRFYMKALHIFLCTLGLQLLLPSGVLTMNGLNGAAEPMTVSDRKFEHGVVQIFGLLTSLAGSAASYCAGYPKLITTHSILGLLASFLASLNAFVGIIAFIFLDVLSINFLHKNRRLFFYIHHTLGVFTILISSACFLCGISDDSFIDWLPETEMLHCLFIFTIFYTCVIIYKPIHFINEQ